MIRLLIFFFVALSEVSLFSQEEFSGNLLLVNLYREINVDDPELHRVVRIPFLLIDDKVYPNESFRDGIGDCIKSLPIDTQMVWRQKSDIAIQYELVSLWMKNDTLYNLDSFVSFPNSQRMYLSAMRITGRYYYVHCDHGINYPVLTDTRNTIVAISNVFAHRTVVGRPDFVPDWFLLWIKNNRLELDRYFENFANYYQFSGI